LWNHKLLITTVHDAYTLRTLSYVQTYLLCKCIPPSRSNLPCKVFIYLFSWILHPVFPRLVIFPSLFLTRKCRRRVHGLCNFCSFQYLRCRTYELSSLQSPYRDCDLEFNYQSGWATQCNNQFKRQPLTKKTS